jgi:hypothetical protein
MDEQTIFRRWYDALGALGEVEQLGIAWGNAPMPSVVWRFARADERLLSRATEAIRSFDGKVDWVLTPPNERGEGMNWSLQPQPDADRAEAAREDFIALLRRVESLS